MNAQTKLVGIVLLLLLGIVGILSTYFQVEGNQVGVVTNFGKFSYIADPGFHLKLPFVNSVTYYRTDLLADTSVNHVNVYTIDNQEVDVLYTVFYKIPHDKVECIFNTNRDYATRLDSITVDRLKTAFGSVNVQSVAEKRGELRDRILDTLVEEGSGLCLMITSFQLTDLQYTEAYRQAVNNAAVQKANIESFEFTRQQAAKQAETDATKAEGQANATRAAAKGNADAVFFAATAEAQAIALKGKATADAMQQQADALKANPVLVDMEKAKRWNGQLPTNLFAGAPMPFLPVDHYLNPIGQPGTISSK